jgi:predicted porin
MTKLFLTMTLALFTTMASAQYSVMTTVIEVEDEYNVTDKIGVGYQINECSMVGITMDGEDRYELLARYAVLTPGLWATCVYNHDSENDGELVDKLELGLGYSFKVWDNLYVDPNYTMPVKADEAGDREGKLNLSLSYKF